MANDEYKNDDMIDLADENATQELADGEIELFDMGDEELDSAFDSLMDEETQSSLNAAKQALLDKYEETRMACKDMYARITKDLKETNNNPYFRTTTTRKIEVLRNAADTEPVDVFEFQNTTGFSLRAIAISAAVVLAADIAAAVLIKKKFF